MPHMGTICCIELVTPFETSEIGSYQLTVSASPCSNSLAPSRIIAIVTDRLNRAGLGFLCDNMALLSYGDVAGLRSLLLAAKNLDSILHYV